MNKVILIGNLTKNPEHKTTPNGISVTTFTVAVQRRMKNADGKYDADFINIVAWRSTADFVAKYFEKGSRIGIVGNIQSRSYEDKNGEKRYVTEVVADEVEFVGGKSENKKTDASSLFGNETDNFEPIEDASLPF